MSITGNTFIDNTYTPSEQSPVAALTVVSAGGKATVALKKNTFTANSPANTTDPPAVCVDNYGQFARTALSLGRSNKGLQLLPAHAPYTNTSYCNFAAIAHAP